MLIRRRLGWNVARLCIVCVCLYASGRLYYKSYIPASSKPGPINDGPDATTSLGRRVHANKEVVAEEGTFGTLGTGEKTYIDTEIDEDPGPIDDLDLKGEYVAVSMTTADRQAARQVVGRYSFAQLHYTRLSMFFKPILDTPMWRDLEEEFDAIVATLWKFVFNTTKLLYSHKDITQINSAPEANEQLDLRQTIDCSTIHRLQLRDMAMEGAYKFVYSADYLGVPVVVKVSKEYLYQEMGTRFTSYIRTNAAMLQEIFMAKIISHPLIQKPRGYCIHDGMNMSGVFMRPGVTAVYDFGTSFYTVQHRILQKTPWRERLRHAVHVADFLRYADNTPLGRLLIGDFKPRQFFMVSNQIVMSDTHMFERIDEENCHINKSHDDLYGVSTKYTISDCRYNMFAAYQTFFKNLLQPEFYPNNLKTVMSELKERIKQYSVNATQLYEALSTLYHEGTK